MTPGSRDMDMKHFNEIKSKNELLLLCNINIHLFVYICTNILAQSCRLFKYNNEPLNPNHSAGKVQAHNK